MIRMLYLSLLLTKTLITIMEDKKYYVAVLYYLGHESRVVIRLDSAVIDSYLKAGYFIEILDSIRVIEDPKFD